MSLSELMSNMNLAFWPQVALLIFLTIFAGVVIRTFSKGQRQEQDEAARLPLQDDDGKHEVTSHG